MTSFHPFEVNAPHLAYTFLGGFIVIFGMLSLFLKEKLYIGEAPLAVVVGIILGPSVLGLFDPYSWGGPSVDVTDEITLEVTRIVIAISVFAVGVELPKAYMKRHWRSLVFLLGPCMVYGWMISALLIWGLIPRLSFLSALVIAASVTPTDPILAQAVIGGRFADKHVPAHIRHILSAESGSNDGAAFPFLGIALYLTLDASPGHAVGEWFYYTWAYEIILGVVLGALLGFGVRKIMKFAERKRLIDRQSYVAQYISLAVLATGGTALLGSDDLLSAFACGCAFAWDGFFNKATEDAVFSNVIDLLFNTAAFIYIGALIPFGSYIAARHVPETESGIAVWRLVVLAISILVVRRLPIIMLVYKFVPDIKTVREALFTGWFGPMGVGAVFISTLARTELTEGQEEHDTSQVDRLREVISPVVLFLVLCSVVTHGLSIPFFSLSRRVHSITYTWSRNPSMDTRRDEEPAWTTHARRIQPGQQIEINRDDDEDGDLGLRHATSDSVMREKKAHGARTDSPGEEGGGSNGSSSSRTRAEAVDEYEMSETRAEERSERDDRVERRREESGSEAASGEEEIHDRAGGGRETPPVVEYREGHHLVIERRRSSGDEVEVEVIRNHFKDDEESSSSKFTHPHRLKVHELDKLLHHIPKSAEHAVSHVENDGKDAIDKLGLGLMHSPGSEERIRKHDMAFHSQDDEEGETSHRDAADNDTAGDQGEGDNLQSILENPAEGRPASPEAMTEEEINRSRQRRAEEEREANESPRVVIQGPDASRLKAPRLKIHTTPRKRNLVDRLLGRKGSDGLPSAVEEGRVPSNPALLSPPSAHSRQRRLNPDATGSGSNTAMRRVQTGQSEDNQLDLTRTQSNRNTTISFAGNVAPPRETAPSMDNYGKNAPGFKRNPTLSLFRSSSVHSERDEEEANDSDVSLDSVDRERRGQRGSLREADAWVKR